MPHLAGLPPWRRTLEKQMAKVFIDGSAGTTGLRIRERLEGRGDVTLIRLPEELRKDVGARRDALNSADMAFLCLPDAAAIEAAALVENPSTVVIDTSTAHRVSDDWDYGMPELPGMRERIAASRRIANPGCHASGFILLAAPLIRAGILAPDATLSAFSLTGYSGGGKKMITQYEDASRADLFDAPRQYALAQAHKHLPEMVKFSGVAVAPAFCPVVADFYSGMEVTVPVFARDLRGTAADIAQAYREAYGAGTGVVAFDGDASEDGFLAANAFAGRDDLHVSVHGNDERILLVARYDNLGKGASGAAIQNMNIALGLDERTGLVL